jgi:hypothetical protein
VLRSQTQRIRVLSQANLAHAEDEGSPGTCLEETPLIIREILKVRFLMTQVSTKHIAGMIIIPSRRTTLPAVNLIRSDSIKGRKGDYGSGIPTN